MGPCNTGNKKSKERANPDMGEVGDIAGSRRPAVGRVFQSVSLLRCLAFFGRVAIIKTFDHIWWPILAPGDHFLGRKSPRRVPIRSTLLLIIASCDGGKRLAR